MKRFPLLALPLLLLPLAVLAAGPAKEGASGAPKVGDKAPELTLDTIDGQTVRLSDLREAGPVVIIQLRGWVGYQCPVCTRQVGGFVAKADELRKAGAKVVLVYPGPPDKLKEHAEQFIARKGLPDNFRFVTDPGLKFVDSWGLRWNEPGETAYPATFVVDAGGIIQFADVSSTHGGRSTAEQVLKVLKTAS